MTREHEVTETGVVSMSLYGAARSEDTSPTLTARKGCQSRFCDSSVASSAPLYSLRFTAVVVKIEQMLLPKS